MSASNSELFLIRQISHTDHTIRVKIGINEDAALLKGHFPGHPVVPGASMLQLVKDILEEALDIQLLLRKADHLKFLSLIAPGIEEFELEINYQKKEEGELFVTAKLSDAEKICFKLQGTFFIS